MTTKKHTLKLFDPQRGVFDPQRHAAGARARGRASISTKPFARVMSSGGVVETNGRSSSPPCRSRRELFEAKAAISSTGNESIERISEYVRPLLPPSKRTPILRRRSRRRGSASWLWGWVGCLLRSDA